MNVTITHAVNMLPAKTQMEVTNVLVNMDLVEMAKYVPVRETFLFKFAAAV